MKTSLDKTDIEILKILKENARTPIKNIASRVFISPPTVAARIEAMEKAGIILGYHAKINDCVLGHPVRAFINLEISPENKDYIRMTFDDGKTEDFFFSNYTKSFFVFFTTFLKERGFQN